MSSRQPQGVLSSFFQVTLRCTLALSPLVLKTTAQPNGVFAPQLAEYGGRFRLPPRRDASLSHTTTLLHRRQGSRISTQALAAIVLCSTVVFCAFIGCLLQLPATLSSWRRRGQLLMHTDTQSTPHTAEFPDTETGGQQIPMAGHLSPPPPYSRAPSYESPGGQVRQHPAFLLRTPSQDRNSDQRNQASSRPASHAHSLYVAPTENRRLSDTSAPGNSSRRSGCAP